MYETKKSKQFHGCPSKVDLFASRVPKEYPEQYIRHMLSDRGVEILGIVKLSHQNSNMSSYKVTVWLYDELKLILQTAWP